MKNLDIVLKNCCNECWDKDTEECPGKVNCKKYCYTIREWQLSAFYDDPEERKKRKV